MLSGLLGGIAKALEVPPQQSVEEVYQEEEEFLERYHPQLKYLAKFENKNIIVTGASGAVGTAVTKKLLKQNCKKIVLFVRDLDNLDEKVFDAMKEGRVKVEVVEFREPVRIETKFSHAISQHFKGELDHVIMCHGVVVEQSMCECTIP